MAEKEEYGGSSQQKPKPPAPPKDKKPGGGTTTPATTPDKDKTKKPRPYTLTRSAWQSIRNSRPPGLAGYANRVRMQEELEPYMGDYPFGGPTLFPGLVPEQAQGYGGYGGGYEDRGGGGGRGSAPLPPPPFKIRTTTGQRLTPYWQSEPDFVQGWQPRLTVLGNTSAW